MSDATEHRGELDLRELLAPVRRWWWLILVIVAVATTVTYVTSSRPVDRFSATAKILVQTTAVQGILSQPLLTTPDRATADQAQLITSRAVAQRVITRLGLRESPGSLVADVTAVSQLGSNIVQVTAERDTGPEAVSVANAFVREHISLRSEQLKEELTAEIDKARRRLRSLPKTVANDTERSILNEGIARLSVGLTVQPGLDRQTDAADVATATVHPAPWRDALFALLVSAALAIALAYGLDQLGLRTRRQAAVGTPERAGGTGSHDTAAGGTGVAAGDEDTQTEGRKKKIGPALGERTGGSAGSDVPDSA